MPFDDTIPPPEPRIASRDELVEIVKRPRTIPPQTLEERVAALERSSARKREEIANLKRQLGELKARDRDMLESVNRIISQSITALQGQFTSQLIALQGQYNEIIATQRAGQEAAKRREDERMAKEEETRRTLIDLEIQKQVLTHKHSNLIEVLKSPLIVIIGSVLVALLGAILAVTFKR